ncbi:hypothetical protein SDC9_96916 [bioreactor metagenome]|uniref:Uncharacterized protein n=1 Tax=bioreactor metagenome TaxID=1076179 RepID=A0A645AAF3_9ZZZZ
MLSTVAPASMAVSNTRQRKSISLLVASSAENSISSQYFFAYRTISPVCSMTSSRVFLSLYSIWISDVAINTWMRGCFAYFTASHELSISFASARERLATVAVCISLAMARTALKSPWDAAANPASITSTPSNSS